MPPVAWRSRRPGVASDHAHYKWWALSCTSLGMRPATVSSGTLIIALPELGRSLHASVRQLVWLILAYMIASTVLVLTAGRLSDLFGRKRAYVGGFVVFALASLAPASPPTRRSSSCRASARRSCSPTRGDPLVVAGLLVAIVLLPAFVAIESRSRAPMLDLEIFRNRTFAAATGAAFINGLSRFALMFVFVFYHQGAQGDDAITAAIKLAPLALGLLASAADRDAGRHRAYTEADAERLEQLLRLKDLLGLSLEELRDVVEAEEARSALRAEWRAGTPSRERRREIVGEALDHVGHQLRARRGLTPGA